MIGVADIIIFGRRHADYASSFCEMVLYKVVQM